ncbi:DUF3888 domain-containing protein [Peribacillus asahii]|uniref:DUF3888 domain-containing protein n=1 Tax=Peribacillus asahii TaxID=228899 RepID=A0A398B3L7_9BACI|nr:DUF3888 domain-containing protein [Peribacillus asahii]RID82396.1 DUF3888 domain-containing protein [Peribacillus asahii]
MKKVGVIFISLFISVYLNGHLVFAEQNFLEKFPQPYVTTQDVLFTLLSPRIDNFVKNNYNETEKNWDIIKVKSVKCNTKKLETWYEIDFLIQVFEEPTTDSYHYDSIKIKVGINDREGKADNKIELVNYKKNLSNIFLN